MDFKPAKEDGFHTGGDIPTSSFAKRRFLPLRRGDAPDQRHAGAKNSHSTAPLTYFTS